MNTGKYGPEKTPNLDTFQAVVVIPTLDKHLPKSMTDINVSQKTFVD